MHSSHYVSKQIPQRPRFADIRRKSVDFLTRGCHTTLLLEKPGFAHAPFHDLASRSIIVKRGSCSACMKGCAREPNGFAREANGFAREPNGFPWDTKAIRENIS